MMKASIQHTNSKTQMKPKKIFKLELIHEIFKHGFLPTNPTTPLQNQPKPVQNPIASLKE